MADRDNFDQNNNQFKSALRNILGSSIRKPISARLGYQDEDGQQFLKVAQTDADQPNQYYFSSAMGQTFVGQAYLQDGALAQWQIRYGAPIRVKQDPINETWEIIGLDVLYAAEFFDGVDPEEVSLIPLRRFEPGLLTSTIPYSMKARVIGGVYDVGDVFYYIPTLDTVDWSTAPHNANVPDEGLAKFVLIQVDVINAALSYKYGMEVPASLTFEQAYLFQKRNNLTTVLPEKDAGYFRSGYIKLAGGMTAIDRRENIWAIQQVLGASSTTADLAETILSRIVTDGEDVVVVDGEVVWVEE